MRYENGKKVLENNDLLSPGEVENWYPQYKARTLQSWRCVYEDTGGVDKIGPKWECYGKRIRKYRVSDIVRDLNHQPWSKPYPPFFREHTVHQEQSNTSTSTLGSKARA